MTYVFNPFTGTLDNVGTSAKKLEEELALYAKLAGRKNAQVLSGGTEAGGTLTLAGTAAGTPGASVSIIPKVGASSPALVINETAVAVTGTLNATKLVGETEVESKLFATTTGSPAGGLRLGRFAFGEPNTPIQIKSNRKEYAALKGKAAWERLESSGEFSILGISTAELTEGESYWLTNFGSNTLKLVSESGEETKEEFRFLLSNAEIELKPNRSIMIAYDPKTKRWRNLTEPVPTIGEGLELTSGYTLKLKAEGVTFSKLGFFNNDAPIEIPAGKTYEVPENIQGLWKDSISVQGTLNVQGHFDEVGVPESTLYGPAIEVNEIFPGSKPLALGKPKDFNLLASQSDWSRPKEEPSLWYRPNTGIKTVTIEGMEAAGFADGTAFFITNRGSFGITFLHNAAGCPTETDRFFLPNEESVTIGKNATVGAIYSTNPGASRWYLFSLARPSSTLIEVEEKAKEFKEAIKLAKTLTVEETLKVHLESTFEGLIKAKNGITVEAGELKAKGGLSVEGTLILPKESIQTAVLGPEAVTFPKLAQFSSVAPIEVAAGKTYEVPENIQGLWKENLSVQGTLNVQGRFDEVGVPEPLWYGETGVPTEVPSGKIYDIPAINSALWRDNMSVQGTINLQGRLTEI